MIASLVGCGPIVVSYSHTTGPYVTGSVRWNHQNQCLEVMDGMNWQQIQLSTPTISMTPEAHELLIWAEQKRADESKIKLLCEKHPGLQEAKDKYDIFLALCKDYDNKKETT